MRAPQQELTTDLTESGAVTFSGSQMIREPAGTTRFSCLSHLAGIMVLCMAGVSTTLGQGTVSEPVSIESLLEEMVDRDAVARVPSPFYQCRQASSWDRAQQEVNGPGWFSNHDYDYSLRQEVTNGRTEYVIMEDQGPGCVTRIWKPLDIGNELPKQTIRFYLDGSSEPAIESDFTQLMSAQSMFKEPFSFIASDEKDSGQQIGLPAGYWQMGGDLYFPIPYAASCKVTIEVHPEPGDAPHNVFFYVVNYRSYEAGTSVKSFTTGDYESASTQALRIRVGSELSTRGTNVVSDASLNLVETIEPGKSALVNLPAGVHAVREIALRLNPQIEAESLRGLWVVMRFDGVQTVECPLSEFFGGGRFESDVHPAEPVADGVFIRAHWNRNRSVGANGEFKSWFVMPYQSGGEFRLVNKGSQAVSVEGDIGIGNWTWDDRSLYFHAGWKSGAIPTGACDWNYIDIKGAGTYVADTLTVLNPRQGWYGEGDERIYIDGESFPSHLGTGTEDYYGYAWGMANFFNSSYISAPPRDSRGKGDWSGYQTVSRERLLDAIPFRTSLKIDMEVLYAPGAQYSVGAMWYATPNTGNATDGGYYWDTDDTTGGFGNTAGTWGASPFWSTSSDGTGATANTAIASADAVNFGTSSLALGSTASTIGIDAGGVTVNRIIFGSAQTDPVTLSGSGGTITLAGTTPTITVDNASDTIGAALAGSASLIKNGAGTLDLTGTNTYTGATTVSGGTLSIVAGGALSHAGNVNTTGGGILDLSGTLTMAADTYFAVGNGIAGTTGTTILNSGANVNLGGNAVLIGGNRPGGGGAGIGTLTINGGTLTVAAASGPTSGGADAAGIWLNPYATAGASTLNLNGGVLSTARSIQDGSGYSSAVNLNGGTLQAAADMALNGNTLATWNVRNSGAIIDSQNFSAMISQVLAHSNIGGDNAIDGGLTKLGTGTLTLSNDGSSFTGNISITDGTLRADGRADTQNPTTSRLGNPQTAGRTITVGSGAFLTFGGNDTLGNAQSTPVVKIIVNGGTINNIGNAYNTLGPVDLNAGTVHSVGGAFATYPSFQLGGTITVGGTAASTISSNGAANSQMTLGIARSASTSTTFNVSDATSSSASDLNVSAVLQDQGHAGANGLIKSGVGTMTLSNTNTYTGTTTVNDGTLSLVLPYLADSADVALSATATLKLPFAATDTIKALYINGVQQAAGSWGRSGHPTAAHTTARITGDGLLNVTSAPPAGYTSWASSFLPAFTNTAADLDFENDGLDSGVEWVVGGNPTLNDAASVAPTFDNVTDPSNFLFTFRRRDTAAADPGTAIVVEYGSNLSGWTPAQDGVSGVTIDATTDLGGGFHQVTVAIPRTLAAVTAKLFARLNVIVAP